MDKLNKILFLPSGVETECEYDENIFIAAQRIAIKIPTACNGSGACGLCRIQIVDGEEYLNKQTKAEINHLGNVYFINKTRLSCQCNFITNGTVVVFIDKNELISSTINY